MPKGPGRKTRKPDYKYKKCLGWIDLDNLDLPRDHFYRRFIDLGICDNCGDDHVLISWRSKYNQPREKGWYYRCANCGQDWCEPKMIPKHKSPEPRFRSDEQILDK